MLQVIPSFYAIFSRTNFFVPADTFEDYIVSKKNCIARHDDKIRFLTKYADHNILIGDIKKLPRKKRMHSASTTNTWSVCIHFSSTDSVAKLLSGVDNSLIMCRGQ